MMMMMMNLMKTMTMTMRMMDNQLHKYDAFYVVVISKNVNQNCKQK